MFASKMYTHECTIFTLYPGMTGTNEYAFIIIPTNYFPLYDWKADPTKSQLYWDEKQKDRDEDAKKAFQVEFEIFV